MKVNQSRGFPQLALARGFARYLSNWTIKASFGQSIRWSNGIRFLFDQPV